MAWKLGFGLPIPSAHTALKRLPRVYPLRTESPALADGSWIARTCGGAAPFGQEAAPYPIVFSALDKPIRCSRRAAVDVVASICVTVITDKERRYGY